MSTVFFMYERAMCSLEKLLLEITIIIMFTVLHEAICTGDPELVRLVLQYRDFEDHSKRRFGINELLQKLEQVFVVCFFFPED